MATTPLSDFLLQTSPFALLVFVFASLLFVFEGGFQTALRMRAKTAALGQTPDLVRQGLMTLMALLLAFGVSMAESRYEQRSSTLIDEANAISTTYLRTSFISGEDQKVLRSLLNKYLDRRIAYYAITRINSEERAQNLKETAALQDQIWEVGARIGLGKPAIPASQLLLSLNQMFDLQNKQDYSYMHRVPRSVIILLFVSACAVSGMVGFSHGTSNKRHPVFSALLIIVMTCTLFVIMDLDRPRRGFIRLGPQVLLDLKNRLAS